MASITTEALAREASPELEAAQQLEEAARFLDLEKWIVQRLRYCEREVQLHSQIISDAGEARIVRALRVQHSSIRGPGMGPLVFSKRMSNADIHTLAMSLTWQWALWKLPFCGSAGLIAADLDELSEREARLLTRYYVNQLRGVLGPQLDVLVPSRNNHPEVMAWAVTALGGSDGRTLASVTGKPASLGGVDTTGIASRFFRSLFGCVMKQYGLPGKGARVALLGFDQTARRLALELERSGTRIVAVADQSGGVHDPAGLNVGLLIGHSEKEQVVFGYPEAQPITIDDMLRLSCDALILCGPDGLRQHPVARVIFEAGGEVQCTLPAKTSVIPPLLADFGLNFAAFCEWRKNSCGGFAEVDGLRGLPVHVRNIWREVWDYAQRHELTLRSAALTLAVSRVAEAMRMK